MSLRGKLTYPIYFDYEEKSIKNRTKEENTKIINAFCDELLSSSYYPGLYIGGNNYLNYTFQEEISCDIWIAHYFNGSSEEKLNTFLENIPKIMTKIYDHYLVYALRTSINYQEYESKSTTIKK